MYNKEQLMEMKVDELRKVASSIGIKNAKRYKKVDLVDMIISVQNIRNMIASVQNPPEAVPEEVVEEVKEEKEEVASVSGNTDNTDNGGIDSNKLRYINEAPIGTLVAFKLPNGQTKSAKIINRSTGRKKLKLETVYGKQFIVSYSDIVWVKSTNKWPRGVYNQLKGIVMEETNGTETA